MRTALGLLFLLAACIGAPRSAAAHALTDLWWSPGEPGWGLTAVHAGRELGVSLLVHDAQGKPRWYSAHLTRYGATQEGHPEFFGRMYRTSGSAATAEWDPALSSSHDVGSMFFRARADGRAELEYTVDGTVVSKTIQRFTMGPDLMTGLHFGMLLPSYDSCAAGFEPLRVFESGTLYVEGCDGGCAPATGGDTGRGITLDFFNAGEHICHIEGSYARYGRSGGLTGTYSCIDGGSGTLRMHDVEFSSVGFSARFSASHPRCEGFTGILSGVRANAR